MPNGPRKPTGDSSNHPVNSSQVAQLKELYQHELLNQVIPFWEKHSPDQQCGGYFTCLARDGSVFDTDKFVWLQGRQIYIFSLLFNQVDRKENWKTIAIQGAEFAKNYAKDSDGNWYFSLTRQGQPLVQPYNIFSDCFMAMGFGELYKATDNPEYRQIALTTYRNILEKQTLPKGSYTKQISIARPLKNFSLPMILSNLALILEDIIGTDEVDAMISPLVHEIKEIFYQKDLDLLFENILADGSRSDSFEGRLINPGHAIEAMWFLMDIGSRSGDHALIDFAVTTTLRMIEYGWDNEHDGIFYFLDYKGHPTQQLEWDQKLWWVHIEALIALIKGYHLTKNTQCWDWFKKLHDYTWNRFRDDEFPEWYGYLNRQGEPILSLKGGKWKGCFHVPRGLFQIYRTLEHIENQETS
ncbi:MAG: AGE family epimerase/isomerase [Sphingobacteriaceae bacterium]